MPSMGPVDDAYDDAVDESFFATIERELVKRRRSADSGRMALTAILRQKITHPLGGRA